MKLLFDENFGRPLVNALSKLLAFSREVAEVRHILDLQTAGKKDSAWVPELAADGWLVVTCDRGKSSGPKLPQLCRAYGITHVLISGRLHNSPQFEKARAVIVVWNDLLALQQRPAGSRFSLRYSHSRSPVLVSAEKPPVA